MRQENEEERHDERRAAALALHGLRGVDGRPLQARRRCRAAVIVPRLAFAEEDPRRDGAARPHVQGRHLAILEDMAGQPRMRRDPPRRPRRRHLDQTQVRRADRAVRRRKRHRVAPRAQRELRGVGGAHVPDRAARRRRHRRRGRHRGGPARAVALDARAKMHLPRVRAGQALHDDAPEDAGRRRPLRHRQEAAEGRGRRRRRRLACLLRRLVLGLRRVSEGEGRGRRRREVQARAAQEGAKGAGEALQGGDPVHLPGRRPRQGRRGSRHQQRHRGRG